MIWHLAAALAVIAVVSTLGARLADIVGQPRVIGEILAGIALGPIVLGAAWGGAERALFPSSVRSTLHDVATIAIVLFVFEVGLSLRWGRRARIVIPITAAAFVVPAVVGAALALVVDNPGTSSGASALFLATAASATALPVLARILEACRPPAEVANLALASAGIQDGLTWSLLAVTFAVAGRANRVGAVALGVPALVLALVAARSLLRRAPAAVRGPLVLVCVAGSAYATSAIGIRPIIGAFICGVLFAADADAHAVSRRIAPLTRVLLPVFFVVVGLGLDVHGFSRASAVEAALLFAVLSAAKAVPPALVARTIPWPRRDSATLGVLLNARGVIELAVLQAGVAAGIVTATLYGELVLVALACTIVATPLVRLLQSRRSPAEAGLHRRGL